MASVNPLPWIIQWLLRAAAERLEPEIRERLLEEWAADVNEARTWYAKLLVAVSLYVAQKERFGSRGEKHSGDRKAWLSIAGLIAWVSTMLLVVAGPLLGIKVPPAVSVIVLVLAGGVAAISVASQIRRGRRNP